MGTEPVVVCRVTWMSRYQGLSGESGMHGAGSYVDNRGWGWEVFNFHAHEGYYYGYVKVGSVKGGINVERLGGRKNAAFVDGVTVIWVAPDRDDHKLMVVGWYTNARAFAAMQPCIDSSRVLPDGDLAGHVFAAPSGRVLLPDERKLSVPKGKGGIGQANVWYPGRNDVQDVRAYIARRS